MSQRNPTDIETTKYAESFVVKGCKTTAFKNVFPNTKAQPETTYSKASQFHKLDKVLARIDELHKSINSQENENALYTIRDALNELEDARHLAESHKQFSAMVSSIMGKAKIAGLLIDNVNQKISGDITVRDFADFYKDR